MSLRWSVSQAIRKFLTLKVSYSPTAARLAKPFLEAPVTCTTSELKTQGVGSKSGGTLSLSYQNATNINMQMVVLGQC
jgi:hypothetical protein